MKNAKKLLALLLALAMCVGVLASCSNNADTTSSAPVTESEDVSSEPSNANETTPLVVATEQGLEGKFSPFFYLSNADNEVVSLTQLGLLTIDRVVQHFLEKNLEEGIANNKVQNRASRARPASTTAPTTPTTAPPILTSTRLPRVSPRAPCTTTSPCGMTSSSPTASPPPSTM